MRVLLCFVAAACPTLSMELRGISIASETGATPAGQFASTTVRGFSGQPVNLVAPAGSCFVPDDSRLGRAIKSRLNSFDLDVRGARVIAAYAPCDLTAPIGKPTIYGGYAQIFMHKSTIQMLGDDFDTAAHLASACAIYRKPETQADDKKAWQGRRARLAQEARELVGRLPGGTEEKSFKTSTPSRVPDASPACLSWALGAETSRDGPSLRSRIMAYGFTLEAASTIHIDHAPFTDADGVDTHLSRMREMNTELRRLNGE
jgi:hypothetical protein